MYCPLGNSIELNEKDFRIISECGESMSTILFSESKIYGFMSKFSSIICDETTYGCVLFFKSRDIDAKVLRYSLRTKKSTYNLGKILSDTGFGGGHENAAGCSVPFDKEEWFENELVRAISPLSLEK